MPGDNEPMPGSIARYNERNKHCKSQVLGSLSCVASVRSSLQSVSRFCKKRVDMFQQIFTLMQQQIPFKRVKFPRPKQTASAPPFVNAVVKYSSTRSMSFISAQQPHWPFDMTPIIAPLPNRDLHRLCRALQPRNATVLEQPLTPYQ